jgi:peptidoglycan/xylan/chitin deacetylase (PgdA/CDA1 family)
MILGHQKLKRVYFSLLSALGEERRLLHQVCTQKHLVILNLHQIGPTPNPHLSPLHPRFFKELLEFIAPHFHVTTFSRLSEMTDDLRPRLILSFDDGYYDYLDCAVPLLDKFRMPANQNVIVESVLGGQPPSTVRLSDFLGQAPVSLIREIAVPGFTRTLRSESIEEKIRFGTQLRRFLKMRPKAEAIPLWIEVEKVIAKFDSFRPSRMLTVAEIHQVVDRHEIGCHSSGHDSMEFESPEFFDRDFDECKKFFKEQLKLPLTIYAFPNGSWLKENIASLRRQNVKHILAVGDGYSKPDAVIHRRFNFYAASPCEGRLRALGFTTLRRFSPDGHLS